MRFTDRFIENKWGLPIWKCRAAFVWLETTLRVRRWTFEVKNIVSRVGQRTLKGEQWLEAEIYGATWLISRLRDQLRTGVGGNAGVVEGLNAAEHVGID